MRSKTSFLRALQLGLLVLAGGIAMLAQGRSPMHFRGTLDDLTPSNVSGPWQMNGTWSLDLNGDSGTANFFAALTMVRSDLGVTVSGNGNLDDPAQRKAHTHHFVLSGTVTPLANGFEITGPITITANGNFPPPFGPSSTATIDITGGNSVAYSNIKLALSGDAAAHFGSQAINGVVRNAE
jgi:hypothetical protein